MHLSLDLQINKAMNSWEKSYHEGYLVANELSRDADNQTYGIPRFLLFQCLWKEIYLGKLCGAGYQTQKPHTKSLHSLLSHFLSLQMENLTFTLLMKCCM